MEEIFIESIHKENLYDNLLKKLSIDCKNCCGLCCVALYFAKTEGFPKDKVPGKPCENLMPDFRCAIHSKLINNKLKGCLAYDCFGAGQAVTQSIYQGKDWKTAPEIAQQMFNVFITVWHLHQMLWYLIEASTITFADDQNADISKLILENEEMTRLCPEDILALDIDNYRARVNQVLKKTCELVSAGMNCRDHGVKSKDFIGKNFKRSNLNGKDFSMALLIAANLEGCSLNGANFLGADLRDANIKNTDLSECVFLTQAQVNAAKGNRNTKLPIWITYPTSW